MTCYWMRFVFAVSMAALSAQGQQRTHADLELLVENHQWPQASSLAEQRLKASPNDARLRWLAAEVRFAYRDLDRAAKLAELAAAGDPDNANYQFALFEIYGSQAEKASLFRQPGLARKAKKAVDRALELDPKHAKALFGSMIYLYRAPSLFGGDRKRALAIPSEVAKFDPARGHMAQAQLDLIDKRDDKAQESYRKAVAANPNLHNARLQLSLSYSSGKASTDLTQAALHAREAVRINPKRVDGWDALAYALGRKGKVAELDSELARTPERSPIFHGARGMLDGGHEAAKAEQLLREYLKNPAEGPERPTRVMAYLRLAAALERQGRKGDAIAELEAANKLQPNDDAIQKELKRLRG